MKHRCFMITLGLLVSMLFASKLFAMEAVGNWKINYLSVTSEGIEFKLKAKQDYTLHETCKNSFFLPNTHAEYDLLAAFLLTASAQKKKVEVVYDETAIDPQDPPCMVEITSLTIY